MIVRITNLERGVRETSGGKEQEGLWLTGIKMEQDGSFKEDEYEKFLSEQFDSEFITTIEDFGIGSELNLSFVKDGKFWNLNSVTDNKARNSGGGRGGKESKPKSTPKNQSKSRDTSAPVQQQQPVVVTNTPIQARHQALALAIEALSVAVKLQEVNPKYKLFPLTKTTPELFTQSLQTTAESFEAFIKDAGKKSKQTEPVAEGETPEVPEDDIPF
jgi:hypothetical protein